MASLFQWLGRHFLGEKRLSFPLRDDLDGLDPPAFQALLKEIVVQRARSAPMKLTVARRTIRVGQRGWLFGAPWRFVGEVVDAGDGSTVEGWLILATLPRALFLFAISLLLLAFLPYGVVLIGAKVIDGDYIGFNTGQWLLAIFWPVLCVGMAGACGLVSWVSGGWMRSRVERDVLETLSA